MNFSRRALWSAMCVLGASLAGGPAAAQLEITITGSAGAQIPAAFVPFGWQGQGDNPPFDVAALVERDLVTSGYFSALERRNMVSRPTQGSQVNFLDWRIVDVNVLLIGELRQTATDQYDLSFQLFDVIRGELLLPFRITTTRDDLRRNSHRIADMVFEEMTGIQGVFDTRIAYITEVRNSPDDRVFSLIVADADGENALTIARSDQPLMSPTWSPDGRRIAYVSFEDRQSAIYVQTLRTGTRERVSADRGVNGAPVFSPDGRRLAVTLSNADGNLDIYIIDLATGRRQRITENAAIDTEAVWSADGRWIYFTSGRPGSTQIYRVQSSPGGDARRVSYEGTYNADASMSPTDEQLAIVHRNQNRDRIALLDPETGVINILSRGTLDESPSFAPNGAMIIYATRDGGQGVLAAVSTDGRVHQRIASVAGDVREPVWSPYARP